MKKLAMSLFVTTLFVSTSTLAQTTVEREYGMGGCGLGSMIFRDDPVSTSQVLAATTNNSTYTQFFAISSGTSGCVESDDMEVTQLEKIQYFVGVNQNVLQKEAARGSGETLSGLSEIMGCPSNDFNRVMKSNYSEIFGNANTAENILKAIKTDQGLAKVCS